MLVQPVVPPPLHTQMPPGKYEINWAPRVSMIVGLAVEICVHAAPSKTQVRNSAPSQTSSGPNGSICSGLPAEIFVHDEAAKSKSHVPAVPSHASCPR